MRFPNPCHTQSDAPFFAQVRQKVYEKDLALSYSPFLPILGTGLVTSDGALWNKQRALIGPALRVDILDDIISIAKTSVDELCVKLEPFRLGFWVSLGGSMIRVLQRWVGPGVPDC